MSSTRVFSSSIFLCTMLLYATAVRAADNTSGVITTSKDTVCNDAIQACFENCGNYIKSFACDKSVITEPCVCDGNRPDLPVNGTAANNAASVVDSGVDLSQSSLTPQAAQAFVANSSALTFSLALPALVLAMIML